MNKKIYNNLFSRIAVILLAAGKSSRFSNKGNVLKQFTELEGKQIYRYSLDFFARYTDFNIFLVIPANYQNFLHKEKSIPKNLTIIEGGDTRNESVYKALLAIKKLHKNIDYCIIHDTARPFIETKILESIISNIENYPSITAGINVNDSIGYGKDNIIEKYIDRDNTYLIQTPQAFNFNILYDSYLEFISENKKINFTDDTSLVFHYKNIKPKIIDGSKILFKVTTYEDFLYAKFIIKEFYKGNYGN